MHPRALIIVLVLYLSSPTPATEPKPFGTAQSVALPILGLALWGASTLDPAPTPHWKGGILVDGQVRSQMRIESRSGRRTAETVGDVLVFTLAAYPLVGDALLDSGVGQSQWPQSQTLALMATQALLVSSAITLATKSLVGRERPYQQECATDPTYDSDCNSSDSRKSFVSGHTSMAFTGAGLLCASREALELGGGRTLCRVALGFATAVAFSRILADKHYLSDTLAGALVGIFSGYVLTKALHYSSSPPPLTAMRVPRAHFSLYPVTLPGGGAIEFALAIP